MTKGEVPVRIDVDCSRKKGAVSRMWALFGYDEPNYTYTRSGKKLLRELAAIGDGPVYVRCHHLLTSGDGTGLSRRR